MAMHLSTTHGRHEHVGYGRLNHEMDGRSGGVNCVCTSIQDDYSSITAARPSVCVPCVIIYIALKRPHSEPVRVRE